MAGGEATSRMSKKEEKFATSVRKKDQKDKTNKRACIGGEGRGEGKTEPLPMNVWICAAYLFDGGTKAAWGFISHAGGHFYGDLLEHCLRQVALAWPSH